MKNPFVDKIFTDADQEVVAYDGSPVDWRNSAYAFVVESGQILLVKNRLEKLYDIPGGGIDLGETLEEALAREALEEAGAKLKIGSLLDQQVDWFYHRGGKYYQTLQLFFTASLVGELNKPSDPDIEWAGFVPISELTKYPLPRAASQVLRAHAQVLNH